MIVAYLNDKTLNPQVITVANQALLTGAIWIDLLTPTRDEEIMVEQCLSLDIPTREEMSEIEISSRLYKDQDALYMTATMLAHSQSSEPQYDAVTFILTTKQLITIRYIEPQAFKLFVAQLQKIDPDHRHAIDLFVGLAEATIDRLADILEFVGQRIDKYSHTIFKGPEESATEEKLNYQQLMVELGTNAHLNNKARESLTTFNRLISFFGQADESQIENEKQLQPRLVTLSRDILSLSDHANFLSSRVNFLLDATLGMVNIEQNNIIKIFSVAAVIFLPPTLIASIYGMNFKFMPELSWQGGYLVALGLMMFSAWLPYKYFKRRKWL